MKYSDLCNLPFPVQHISVNVTLLSVGLVVYCEPSLCFSEVLADFLPWSSGQPDNDRGNELDLVLSYNVYTGFGFQDVDSEWMQIYRICELKLSGTNDDDDNEDDGSGSSGYSGDIGFY